MRIVKKLNVPASYFFDTIIEAVLKDIKTHTGKQIIRKQLKNFEYLKEFPNKTQGKIKIEKFVENKAYSFRTSTIRTDYIVSYKIKPITESSCEVVYQEKVKSFSALQKINDAVVGSISSVFKKRNFLKMLSSIEAAY